MEDSIGYKEFTEDVIFYCKSFLDKYNFHYQKLAHEDYEKSFRALFENKSLVIEFYVQFPYNRANYSLQKNGVCGWQLNQKLEAFLGIDPEEEKVFFEKHYIKTSTSLRETCKQDLTYYSKYLPYFYDKVIREDFSDWNTVFAGS
jgi:hypothetical protein